MPLGRGKHERGSCSLEAVGYAGCVIRTKFGMASLPAA